MLLSYSNWKKIFEQDTDAGRSVGTVTTYSTDPDVKEVAKFFTEYLSTLIPNYYDTPIGELNQKMKALTDQQLAGSIEFFKSKGFNQPGDPKIIKFQKDLMTRTDVKQFTSADGKSANFDDGTFGAATAKAAIAHLISVREKLAIDPKKTLRQHGERTNQAKAAALAKGEVSREPVAAPKTKTGADVKLDIGTQKVQ